MAKKAGAAAGKKRNAADLTRRNEQAVNRRISEARGAAAKAVQALRERLESQEGLWDAAINRINTLENRYTALEERVTELESNPATATGLEP